MPTLLLGLMLAAAPEPLSASGPLRLDLPLLDEGFNTAHGYQAPSMAQSLAIARDVQGTVNWAIDFGFEELKLHPALRWGLEGPALMLGTVLFLWVPLGGTWNHEEFHRATLSWRGIASTDDVNSFPFGRSTISVSHVLDEDLVRFKAEHPAEFARMSAAGMEGDIELSRSTSQSDFFDRRSAIPNLPSLLYTRLNVVAYLLTCDSAAGDEMTAAANATETDPRVRDFTGADCVGWAYDVQRPDEPYQARGAHPSGVGIDRYRKTTDLTSDERTLLTTAKWLSLANLADLSLWGLELPVPTLPDWRWTFGFSHQLTSFGQALTLDLLARGPDTRLRASYRHYLSQHLQLPGVEVEWVRKQVHLGPVALDLTPSASVWLQPAGQRWDAPRPSVGAQVKARVAWTFVPRLNLFAEVQAKTAGWVPGTVLLDPGVDFRLGLGAVL